MQIFPSIFEHTPQNSFSADISTAPSIAARGLDSFSQMLSENIQIQKETINDFVQQSSPIYIQSPEEEIQVSPTPASEKSDYTSKTYEKTVHEEKDSSNVEDSDEQNAYFSYISDDRMIYAGQVLGLRSLESPQKLISQEDLHILHGILEKNGASKESLQELESLALNDKHPTIGKIIQNLSVGKRKSLTLDEKESADFVSFLKKLSFSQEEALDLLQLSDEGKNNLSWKIIDKKLSTLTETISIEPNELKALLRGLDIAPEKQKSLLPLLNKGESFSVNKEELKLLLAGVQSEMSKKEVGISKMKEILLPSIDEMLNESKINSLAAVGTDKRADAKSIRLEQRIQDSILTKSQARDVLMGIEEVESTGLHKASLDTKEVSFSNSQDESEQLKKVSEKKELTLSSPTQTRTASDFGSDSSNKDTHSQQNSSRNLFSQQTAMGLAFDAKLLNQQHMMQNKSAQIHSSYKEEFFSQIESVFLQNMHTGTQKLTVQLSQELLGNVNIVLSLHEGSVKGVLKAESQETLALLNEQLPKLKALLEDNGIKVAELEVQSGLQENNSSSHWQQEAESHNLWQQQKEQANLSRVSNMQRQIGESKEHLLSRASAPAPAQGLHLIA